MILSIKSVSIEIGLSNHMYPPCMQDKRILTHALTSLLHVKVWDVEQVEEACSLQSSGPNLGNWYALLCKWIYFEFQVFMGCKFRELHHIVMSWSAYFNWGTFPNMSSSMMTSSGMSGVTNI
jgi:hypothetical protein